MGKNNFWPTELYLNRRMRVATPGRSLRRKPSKKAKETELIRSSDSLLLDRVHSEHYDTNGKNWSLWPTDFVEVGRCDLDYFFKGFTECSSSILNVRVCRQLLGLRV